MNIILFDDIAWKKLLPLTFVRPVSEVRIGILTIKEKWERYFNCIASYVTQEYLSEKFALICKEDNILINGSVLPDVHLTQSILNLELGQALMHENILIALRLNEDQFKEFHVDEYGKYEEVSYDKDIIKIDQLWDIFAKNDIALALDFEFITQGRKSAEISDTNSVLAPENIFIEEGAVVECATLNAMKGPIYIGKDAEVMEGSLVRGGLALCEGATLKLGTKIYGATTVGPHSKVGGEVSNSVIFGYSNKGHDGYLGNAVLGEWCNIGAGSNNSNLKNDYSEVRLWSYEDERFLRTGLQFCGLIMGDYSKCGISSMFNTGTVIGVNVNYIGTGFPRNFIESFSWGGVNGYSEYNLKKAFNVAEKVMQRRGIEFTEADENILTKVFEMTASKRKF